MQIHEMSDNLELIKNTLERARTYTYHSGLVALFFGVLSLIPSVYFLKIGLDLQEPNQWLLFCMAWAAVFLASLSALTVAVWVTARQHGIPFLSETVKTIGFILSPSLLLAGVFSVLFYYTGHFELIPGSWLVCYGCGFLSASVFQNAWIKLYGFTFLAFGVAFLILFSQHTHLMMLIGFGGLHIILGAVQFAKRSLT